MSKQSIPQPPAGNQAPPVPMFTAQSIVDGFPVSLHVDLAAVHVHEEIRAVVGLDALPRLHCTPQYRNRVRRDLIALIEGSIGSPAGEVARV